MKSKTILGAVLAAAGPFVVVTAYLVFSRWPVYWWSAPSDYAALVLAVALGVVGLCLVVRSPLHRVVASVGYICAAVLMLVWYSLSFLCSAFGDCL